MQALLIQHAQLYLEGGEVISDAWVLIQDGLIQDLGDHTTSPHGDRLIQTQVIDAAGAYVLPGFIDVHVHGAVGADTMDADPDSLLTMAAFFAQHGVTSFLATTLTASHTQILAALQSIDIAMQKQVNALSGARILGAHLEGPYLNVEQCGAQNPDYVRACSPAEAQQYLDTGVLRLVSIAPEIQANNWLLDACVKQGITVSIAHTKATYEQARQAIARGIRHSTHTYNAMTGLHHREAGTLGAVMLDARVFCELIADTIHVQPAAMRILWQMVGSRRLIIITDAMRATGMPDGHYQLGDLDVTVADGRACLADGTLAGSVLTMDAGLRYLLQVLDLPLHALWQTSSYNAALSLGLADHKGKIAIGYDADLVLLDADLQVQQTLVGGKTVYLAK